MKTAGTTPFDVQALMPDAPLDEGAWPELRIVRQASIEVTPLASQWRLSLDQLGHVNYGKGVALALGSVHVTYVSAIEMGRMLEAKFPKVYQNRRKTRQLHGKVADHFMTYTRQKTQDHVDSIFGRIELNNAENIDAAKQFDDAVSEEVDTRKWAVGAFVLDEWMHPESRILGMGFDTQDELMHEEMADCLTFLQDEGLDTRFVDRNRQHHIRVFEALQPVATSQLHIPEFPVQIDLLPPKALQT